jgi:hypothetical protein
MSPNLLELTLSDVVAKLEGVLVRMVLLGVEGDGMCFSTALGEDEHSCLTISFRVETAQIIGIKAAVRINRIEAVFPFSRSPLGIVNELLKGGFVDNNTGVELG